MMSIVALFISISLAQVSEKELVEHVLEQFPSVQIAQEELRAAEGQLEASRGAFDLTFEGKWIDSQGDYNYEYFDSRLVKPTPLFGLDLYAGYRRSTGLIPLYYGEMETLNEGEWNVGFKIPLLRNFLIDSRRASLETSKIEAAIQKLELRATELKTVESSLFSYWDWYAALEKTRVYRKMLEIAETRNSWLEKRAKSGDIARFDLTDNLRTILIRRSALLEAELELTRKSEQLLLYISSRSMRDKIDGAKNKTEAPLKELNIPKKISNFQSDVYELVQRAQQERPEFAIIAAELKQIEIDRRLQKNLFLPRLDLSGEYSKDSGVGSPKLGEDNTKIALQFEVPLQYRLARGRLQEAEAKVSILEKRKEFLSLQWKAEIAQLIKNYEVATERNRLSVQEFQLAQELEQGERLRLRRGDTNLLIVNLREQATAEASVRVIETTADALKAYAQLEIIVGKIPFLKQ